jgi:hypothetical protein
VSVKSNHSSSVSGACGKLIGAADLSRCERGPSPSILSSSMPLARTTPMPRKVPGYRSDSRKLCHRQGDPAPISRLDQPVGSRLWLRTDAQASAMTQRAHHARPLKGWLYLHFRGKTEYSREKTVGSKDQRPLDCNLTPEPLQAIAVTICRGRTFPSCLTALAPVLSIAPVKPSGIQWLVESATRLSEAPIRRE